MNREKFLIKPEEEFFSPTYDVVFKAMLTLNTDASNFALRDIISAFTGHEVKKAVVKENEPQTGNKKEKHIRLDVNCVFNDDQLANVEMTMDATGAEFVRIEQYLARNFGGIKTQGIEYKDYPFVYQISLISNRNIIKNDNIVNIFAMCNIETKEVSDGRMRIIIAELKKFKKNK